MSTKKRTIDAFFGTPKSKKPRSEAIVDNAIPVSPLDCASSFAAMTC